jgi:hypothetical protein
LIPAIKGVLPKSTIDEKEERSLAVQKTVGNPKALLIIPSNVFAVPFCPPVMFGRKLGG